MISTEIYLLNATRVKDLENCDDVLKTFCKGDYKTILQEDGVKELLQSDLTNCHEVFRPYLDDNVKELKLLTIGAAALQLFVQNNWTGPYVDLYESSQPKDRSLLSVDGESVYHLVRFPQLLALSKEIFLNAKLTTCVTNRWWALRVLKVHQSLLPELSQTLLNKILDIIGLGIEWNRFEVDEQLLQKLQVEYWLEIAGVYTTYHQSTEALKYIKQSQSQLGLEINLTGAMGKRTKYQTKDVAQLIVKIERKDEEKEIDSTEKLPLPKNIALNDDTLLEATKLTDGSVQAKLKIEDHAVLLATMKHVKQTSPVDELIDEELMTYIKCIVDDARNWCIQTSALYFRSLLEREQSRRVGRSMQQLEELVDQFKKEDPSSLTRTVMFYCTFPPPTWVLEKELAKVLISLGAVNSALEVFLRLEMWHEVIMCYTQMGRRANAEKIVRAELEKHDDDPLLYCYLGDATDDIEHYEKAWELSKHRCARAQKSIGQFYFKQKKYSDCIKPFQECLELNSLQVEVWFQLGFAATTLEEWDLASKAYRQCVTINTDNFEAWNNLSNVYIHMGQKLRAHKALQEALRCNYHHLNIRENFLVVSVDCGAFDDVITSYHHILDMKEKFLDEEVLQILVRSIVQDIPDIDEQPAHRLKEKALILFGRITSKVTYSSMVWKLYADLYSSNENPSKEIQYKIVQFRLKAQRAAVQKPNWEQDDERCRLVLERSIEFVEDCITRSDFYSMLVSARMLINSVIASIKQYEERNGISIPTELTMLVCRLQDMLSPLMTAIETNRPNDSTS